MMGREPFEAVVQAHHGEIYRFLRRVTFGTSEAEDLSQETFVRAFRAYHSLPVDANVRAWLFTIASNLYRNHVRTETRRRVAHAALRTRSRESDGEGPEGEALFNEARCVMEMAIQQLPVKQRMAFVLRKVHDLPYEEIARSLHCSAETARAHVFQAFRKIRNGLDRYVVPAAEVPE
jgi:RNA polymerase sigma factor (sigma-70 family)